LYIYKGYFSVIIVIAVELLKTGKATTKERDFGCKNFGKKRGILLEEKNFKRGCVKKMFKC